MAENKNKNQSTLVLNSNDISTPPPAASYKPEKKSGTPPPSDLPPPLPSNTTSVSNSQESNNLSETLGVEMIPREQLTPEKIKELQGNNIDTPPELTNEQKQKIKQAEDNLPISDLAKSNIAETHSEKEAQNKGFFSKVMNFIKNIFGVSTKKEENIPLASDSTTPSNVIPNESQTQKLQMKEQTKEKKKEKISHVKRLENQSQEKSESKSR